MNRWKSLALVGTLCLLTITVSASPDNPIHIVAQEELTPRAYLPIVHKAVWRPFSDSSPWNTPAGPNPEIDRDSDAMIATLAASSTQNGFWINRDDYTIPIYYADAGTPTYDVPCTNPWDYCGSGFGQDVPIPDGAMPDPEDDGHMTVLDLRRNLAWDMYRAERTGDGWATEWGYLFDLGGDGRQSDGMGSARGSGFPLIAGLIRLEEIKQGHIGHALVMAYDEPRADVYVYPASVTFTQGKPDAIPMGGRIQLDPTLDLGSLGLSPAAKVIARALQEYGAYVCDFAGAPVLYAEGLYGKPDQSWNGILEGDDLMAISWQSYRVLKLPPLKTMPGSSGLLGGLNEYRRGDNED